MTMATFYLAAINNTGGASDMNVDYLAKMIAKVEDNCPMLDRFTPVGEMNYEETGYFGSNNIGELEEIMILAIKLSYAGRIKEARKVLLEMSNQVADEDDDAKKEFDVWREKLNKARIDSFLYRTNI